MSLLPLLLPPPTGIPSRPPVEGQMEKSEGILANPEAYFLT